MPRRTAFHMTPIAALFSVGTLFFWIWLWTSARSEPALPCWLRGGCCAWPDVRGDEWRGVWGLGICSVWICGGTCGAARVPWWWVSQSFYHLSHFSHLRWHSVKLWFSWFQSDNLLGHLVHFFQPCLVPGEELCYLKILTFTLSLPPCFNLVEVARPMLLTDIVTRIFMMMRSAVGTIFPNMNQIRWGGALNIIVTVWATSHSHRFSIKKIWISFTKQFSLPESAARASR